MVTNSTRRFFSLFFYFFFAGCVVFFFYAKIVHNEISGLRDTERVPGKFGTIDFGIFASNSRESVGIKSYEISCIFYEEERLIMFGKFLSYVFRFSIVFHSTSTIFTAWCLFFWRKRERLNVLLTMFLICNRIIYLVYIFVDSNGGSVSDNRCCWKSDYYLLCTMRLYMYNTLLVR